MRRAALAGGAEVRFLRLAEHDGQLREPHGSALRLPPSAAAAGAAWSPDGHLLALATQVPSRASCAGAAFGRAPCTACWLLPRCDQARNERQSDPRNTAWLHVNHIVGIRRLRECVHVSGRARNSHNLKPVLCRP